MSSRGDSHDIRRHVLELPGKLVTLDENACFSCDRGRFDGGTPGGLHPDGDLDDAGWASYSFVGPGVVEKLLQLLDKAKKGPIKDLRLLVWAVSNVAKKFSKKVSFHFRLGLDGR